MQKMALKSHKKQLGAQNTFLSILDGFSSISSGFSTILDGFLMSFWYEKKFKLETSAARMAGLRFPNTYAIHYTLYAIRYTLYAIRDTL